MFYKIAEFVFSIELSNKTASTALLPNFEPFLLRDTIGLQQNLLFRMVGNKILETPPSVIDDCFEWNETAYEVSHTVDNWFISMVYGGKKHMLYSTHNWQYLYTDLTFTEKSDSVFLNNFLIIAFGMATASKGVLKMHASVIEKEGNALLFLGESGTGKSTHSRLWLQFIPGCTLLNDDEPIVRVHDDGTVWVYGSPWSGKTPCYRNIRARVRAFVHLQQGPRNRLSSLSGRMALTSLFTSSCMMRNDDENKNHIFTTIADVLEQTPVYQLECRPDYGAVCLTESLMDD